jgi:hypothetical protein
MFAHEQLIDIDEDHLLLVDNIIGYLSLHLLGFKDFSATSSVCIPLGYSPHPTH